MEKMVQKEGDYLDIKSEGQFAAELLISLSISIKKI